MKHLHLALLLPVAACASIASPDDGPEGAASTDEDGRLPTIAAHTADMTRVEGFVPLYWNADEGRLYLETSEWEQPILYYVSLPGGLGSNDVGLDRGQIGTRQVLELRCVGRRVLLVAPNLRWRSSAPAQAVRQGVRASFAESVLWGFNAVAEEEGRLLVDATDFFLRDAHAIARKLSDRGQGSFKAEPTRSTILPAATRGFPGNTEVEVLLTFSGERPGAEVRGTAAAADAVSLRVRHSWVQLPSLDDEFRPRPFDPRCGSFPSSWNDVSVAIDAEMTQRVVPRHHLTAERPIVYYVDRAAPEPVRTALLEGARYWQPAFAAAGFPDGFRVELLPADADPQDVRYNVIQWVNRSTRGWSYGDSVIDPRTGRILKGHVTLGALRVRQDVLLIEGLLSPYRDDGGGDARVTDTALARIRQLSAHEVGHTLGFAHNFAASADGRASVMDYPAPLVTLDDDGRIDLSGAYREGGGAWDEMIVRHAYTRFADAEAEARGLAAILDEMRARELHYMSDSDARGAGRAHPLANLWDNGADPVEHLATTYEVRRAALGGFSAAAIQRGRPLAALEDALVPLYLHHRYQIEAAIRSIGGVEYEYAVRGDSSEGVRAVPAERQRRALELAQESVQPAFLELPRELRASFPPPPPGYARTRESFEPGGLLLDPLRVAAASIEVTLGLLWHPERVERVIAQSARDPEQVSAQDLFVGVLRQAFAPLSVDPEHARLQSVVRELAVDHLIELATAERASPAVRGTALSGLAELREQVQLLKQTADWQGLWLEDRLRRFFEEPMAERGSRRAPHVPPGSPIGCGLGG